MTFVSTISPTTSSLPPSLPPSGLVYATLLPCCKPSLPGKHCLPNNSGHCPPQGSSSLQLPNGTYTSSIVKKQQSYHALVLCPGRVRLCLQRGAGFCATVYRVVIFFFFFSLVAWTICIVTLPKLFALWPAKKTFSEVLRFSLPSLFLPMSSQPCLYYLLCHARSKRAL